MPVSGRDFESMWADLLPVGRSATSGGYRRLPFGAAERECVAWFEEQAASRGLDVQADGNGNLVAWWRPPDGSPGGSGRRGGVVTGSHLDSVLDGGAYDGPLGVVSGLAALDVLRDRGFRPTVPAGVAVFVGEEGSRFGLACLGTRLLTGASTAEQAGDLRDADGIPLLDAMSEAGLEPALGQSALLDGISGFIELHIEQGRDLADRERSVGVAAGIWPHGRYRFEFTGEPNHAGTTPMEDRHDPMLSYAMTALAANKRARLAGQRATFGRVEVVPNGTNAVPLRVTGWLDARASTEPDLEELVAAVSRQADERTERDGTALTVTVESASPAVTFDADLARRIAALAGEPPWPVVPTAAGHDAGVLASAGIRTAMLFVRNPTGISHSPAEHADTADCLAGVQALADTIRLVCGSEPPAGRATTDGSGGGGRP